MNTTRITLTALVAAAAAFAAPAFAQEATPDGFAALHSSASRSAVQADAVAALKAGTLERGEASVDRKPFVSTKSRAQVAAEGREALRLGVVGHGEGPSPVLTPAQAESIRMAGLQAASQWLATR